MNFYENTSIVITAHRHGPMLNACLDSVKRLNPPPKEIIVAIDGSSPFVKAAAIDRDFQVVSLRSAPGVSAARNAGANASTGEFIIFVDSDVELPRNYLESVAEIFAHFPDAAAVIGSYDNTPACAGVISQYRNLLHHFTHQHSAINANTFWAACGAVRRQAFQSINGFDESFSKPSVEDIEFGYRLRAAGYQIRLEPNWQVKHLKSWHFKDLIVTDFVYRALPWSKLLRRYGKIENDLNLTWLSRISALLVCCGASSMLLSFYWHQALVAGITAFGLAAHLNWEFYKFLASSGGRLFAAICIPLHFLYFIVGAAGFATAMMTTASANSKTKTQSIS